MAISNNSEPVDPKQVRAFALFFKRYMSISTLVVASLPIPVTALGTIPTFNVHRNFLSVYTSLFCFLTLGFIFYSRHKLARIMFPEYFTEVGFKMPTVTRLGRGIIRALPIFLIVMSIVCVVLYHEYLDTAVALVSHYSGLDSDLALQMANANEIPFSARLLLLYLSIFLTAEGAFVLMALKEYLQDLVGLTEMELIKGPRRPEIKIIKEN